MVPADDGLRRSPELHPEAEHLIVATRERVRLGLPRRDRMLSFGLAAGFLVTSLVFLAMSNASTHASLLTAALYAVLYGLLARVRFEVGVGYAIPVQLVLVPMLFVLPLPWVPLCVAIGILFRDPQALLHRRLTPSRAALRLLSAWHAVGPAVVLALAPAADRAPRWGAWPIYVAALSARSISR